MRQGWHFWSQRTRTGCERAIDCFKRAISESPSDFVRSRTLGVVSHAGHLRHAVSAGDVSALSRGARAGRRVGGLRPELRCNRAFGLYVFEQRRVESEAEFLQTLKEKPSLGSAYVRLGMLCGRSDALRRGAGDFAPRQTGGSAVADVGGRRSAGALLAEISTRPQRSGVRVSSCIRICGGSRQLRAGTSDGRPTRRGAHGQVASIISPDAHGCVRSKARVRPCWVVAGCARDAGGARGAEANECVDAYYMAVFRSALGQPREALAELGARMPRTRPAGGIDPKLDALRGSTGIPPSTPPAPPRVVNVNHFAVVRNRIRC